MAQYRAIRAIDYPLGSGVWAFAEGDEVPEASVKQHGYDNPEDCYVEQVDAAPEPAAAPVAEPEPAEADKSE